MPWMLCGGCHAGRTSALADIMKRHTLFFQGNDVEVGILASRLGYRVGHVLFPVPTTVPASAMSWIRQRSAWAGGEFRLFLINFSVLRQHPFMWTYGLLVMFIGLPFRWHDIIVAPVSLIGVLFVYFVLTLILNWRTKDRWLPLLPIYAAFSSLVMLTIAGPSYVLMAVRSRNLGLIRS